MSKHSPFQARHFAALETVMLEALQQFPNAQAEPMLTNFAWRLADHCGNDRYSAERFIRSVWAKRMGLAKGAAPTLLASLNVELG